MSRFVRVKKPSLVLMWQNEIGEYDPIAFSKLKFLILSLGCAFFFTATLFLTTYLYFKNDILISLIQKHHEQSIGYEDRILKMRASLDRITAKQVIDQDHFERKMGVIVAKQTDLEKKQSLVSSLSERLGVKFEEGVNAPTSYKKPNSSPRPLDDLPTGSIQKSEAKPNFIARLFGAENGFKAAANLNDILETVASNIKQLETKQLSMLETVHEEVKNTNQKLTESFKQLNIPLAKEATGGIYIPYKANEMDNFALLTLKVEQQFERLNLMKSAVKNTPLARPLPKMHEITSGYGRRIDPFKGSVALHSGIDFRGSIGDPVYATGSGKVVTAENAGGYGLLIEIEHQNGFSTRYAHLSTLHVQEGQMVEAGQIIGRVGSTGRSTGPHLHYEIRKNDEAQDPLHFLKIGALLR